MKKYLLIAAFILSATVFIAADASAQSCCSCRIEDTLPTINARGEGKVTVKPDEAEARFGVTVEGQTLKKAYALHTLSMNALIKAVKAMGISEDDIRSSSYSVSPIYPNERNSYGKKIDPIGYRVSHQVTVKIRDISKAGDVIDAAMETGATFFYGMSFDSSKRGELEREAKIKAAEDAKVRAAEVAGALGVKVGRVIKIDQSQVSLPRPVMTEKAYNARGVTASSPDIEAGSLDIRAYCSVVFEISE